MAVSELATYNSQPTKVFDISSTGFKDSTKTFRKERGIVGRFGKKLIEGLMEEKILPKEGSTVFVTWMDVVNGVLPPTIEGRLRTIKTLGQIIQGEKVTLAQIGIRTVMTTVPFAEIAAKVVASKIFGTPLQFLK